MDVVESLPKEVSHQIFSRLPKKSRLRCEAVSKRWQNLIEETASLRARSIDTGFVHINYCKDGWTANSKFYRLDDKGSLHLLNSFVFHRRYKLSPVGSSNGFLIYTNRDGDPSVWRHALYNPVTRRLTTLPPPPPLIRMHVEEEADCFLRRLAVGFAPDLDTNHYKFLVVGCKFFSDDRLADEIVKVAIFNSETGEWKTLEKKFKRNSVSGAAKLYFKGNLYWLDKSCLRVFCMKAEIFRRIELPKVQQLLYCGVVWESEGNIHYCQLCEIQGLCIWVLEEDPKSEPGNMSTHYCIWRKIYSVDKKTFDSILAEAIKPAPSSTICPITRFCAFNEQLQILYLDTRRGLFSYDISGKTMSPLSPFSLNMPYAPFSPYSQNMPSYELLPFTYNDMPLTGRRSGKRGRASD